MKGASPVLSGGKLGDYFKSLPITIRLIQQCFKQILEPICEGHFSKHSYSFRLNRSLEDTIANTYRLLQHSHLHYVIEFDIKSCFDNISHDWILKYIPLDKKLLKKWLRSGYIETKRLFPIEKGTAQGSPISPTICNMVLNVLEMTDLIFLAITSSGTKIIY